MSESDPGPPIRRLSIRNATKRGDRRTIEPERKGIFRRIVPRVVEHEKDMDGRAEVDVAAERPDALCRLADALVGQLLVPHSMPVRRSDLLDARRLRRQLPLGERLVFGRKGDRVVG